MGNVLQATPTSEASELLRIATVDDDPAEHVIMSMAMSHAGYPSQVTYYHSGTALLEALTITDDSEMPDVILLDLRMPGMSGYDTLDRLQTNPLLYRVPVVIFTSSDRPAEREQAIERGAALFQTKPPDLDSMQVLIGSLPLLVSLHQRPQGPRANA